MTDKRIRRRLAAIMAADVVGYSRLMHADETGTLARLKALRADLFDPKIAEYDGRIVKTTGDGILVEFPSAVDAVQHAVDVQRDMAQRNAHEEPDRRLDIRIGINVGDVIVDGDDLFGDGVNVAARLEGLAESGGVTISGSVYDQVRHQLDLPFRDLGMQSVKNIDDPIHVYRIDIAAPPVSPARTKNGKARAIPSIAVLPFNNMSDDPEQEFFADGLVEDIITTLSKLSGLIVIARNSSFVYKGRAVDIREVARELGVRYVLEGSVRKAGNRIRITAQLIDADNGAHVWAERYDRAIDDIFAVQDEITLMLATEMQVRLTEGEQARLRYSTTGNVAAWTLWAEGLRYFRGAVTKDNFTRIRDCWQRALALDPDSASLHGMLAFVHYADARFGWWDDRETALRKGRDHVDAALVLDPDNADAHMSLSLLLMLMRRHDEAVVHARKSVALAPGSADAATFACFVLASSGYPEEAVVEIEKAMTLSPNYPASYLGHLGNAYRLSGRIDEAIAAFREYDARSPGFGLTDLVIACQQSNRVDEARDAATRLRAARPNFTVTGWLGTQFRSDVDGLAADAAALRAAGLPDD